MNTHPGPCRAIADAGDHLSCGDTNASDTTKAADASIAAHMIRAIAADDVERTGSRRFAINLHDSAVRSTGGRESCVPESKAFHTAVNAPNFQKYF